MALERPLGSDAPEPCAVREKPCDVLPIRSLRHRIRVTGSAWNNLVELVLADRTKEQAAFLYGYPYRHDGEVGIVASEVLPLRDEGYIVREVDSLRISTRDVAPMLKRARGEGGSLVFVHTHPWSVRPQFSSTDDFGQNEFFPAALARADGPHGSIVLGAEGAAARVHDANGTHVAEIWSIGDLVRRVDEDLIEEEPAAHLSRQVAALGGRDRTLRHLRVAVVGAGGTGSAVLQQLFHMGVRDVLVIDPDVVEVSNLNRLVLADLDDAHDARPKVEIAIRRASRLAPTIAVTAKQDDVRFCDVALSLRDRDLIFACTDSHSSRVLLNAVAWQYAIPVVDIGVRVVLGSDGVRDAVGEIRLVGPTRTCLICQRSIDPEAVSLELMTPSERGQMVERGYVVGGPDDAAPSLVTMTSGSAAFAVAAAISWLGIWGAEPPPSITAIDFPGLRLRRIAARAHEPGCPVGGAGGSAFLADRRSLPCRQRGSD